MKKITLALATIITVFSFLNFIEAPASLEWRNYYQEGNMYVIEVFTPQICLVEFYWKEQSAQQGAYQLIGSLSRPNEGNLYQIKWDIMTLSDGNYTILVKSPTDEIEQNVVVNRAHWDITPLNLTYPGWVDAEYVGTIEGAVDSHPKEIGILYEYEQYFRFTKQDNNKFRIAVDYIPDDILLHIYQQLYSNGASCGTLFFQINDDLLEIRVFFPGYPNFRPGDPDPESEESTDTETPDPPPQQSEELSSRLAEFSQKLDQVTLQNTILTQEITNLHNIINEKEEKIRELEYELDLKEQEKEKVKEESQSNILLYIGMAAAAGGGIVYMFTKNTQTPQRPPQQRGFMHGRPFQTKSSGKSEQEQIPGVVFMAAREHNLDIVALNDLVKQEKKERPHLSDERALNSVLNKLTEDGEI